MVGFILYLARRYDDAIEALKNTVELDKNYDGAYLYLGYAYAAKEMYADAIASYQQAIKLGDESPSTQISLGSTYARAGEREKAQAILKSLQTSKEYRSPGELALLYAALGDWEEAFASLEKAYAGHDLQLQYLGVDPAFDPIRSDPRFTGLMRRVGLTP
jgi:tetratricopeptide (TPR) repeat protein